jgi:outer membrane protein TolC
MLRLMLDRWSKSVLLALVVGLTARTSAGQDAGQTPTIQRVTLGQAIQRALAQNVTMVVAIQEIRRAEALLKEARASSFPTVNVNGIYTRLDSERRFGANRIAAQDQFLGNVTLSVPLIVPQRWAQWSHASNNVDLFRATAEDVRRQTALAVARAYLMVLSQKRAVDVNEHALKTAKAHYDFAHTRLLGGIGNRVDDVRAEQEVATVQAQIETSYAALARAREALGVLLGDQGPLDAVDRIDLAESPTLPLALDEAARRRSDVALLQKRVDAAERVRKDSYTDYLPFLIGTFQPFYQHPTTAFQPQTGWQAQLLLTIPIYDGGLRYGLAEERASLSAEARAQYEALLRQARSEVRIAFESVKRAEASLAAAVNAARLARDALELATLAYRAGATTNLEVIDAERRAHQADTAVAVAEDGARQARIDLLAATGRFP